jgi:hypothetical protein
VNVEAISWALNLAPVSADGAASRRLRASSCSSAWPTTPCRTARARSRRGPRWPAIPGCRSGRYASAWTGGRPGASPHPATGGIVAARIKRADCRPPGWGLTLNLVRYGLDSAAFAVLTARSHGWPSALARLRSRR